MKSRIRSCIGLAAGAVLAILLGFAAYGPGFQRRVLESVQEPWNWVPALPFLVIAVIVVTKGGER